MNADITKDTNKATDAEILEVLAFELACQFYFDNGRVARDRVGELWRDPKFFWDDDLLFRDHWRACALPLLAALQKAGVRVRAGNSRLVKESLREIVTVPARVAYELPLLTPLPAFDQSDDDEEDSVQ